MTTKTKKEAKPKLKFDFKTIKTFEDACNKVSVDPSKLPEVSMIPEDLRKPIISAFNLMIIFLAINDGWKPNWGNYSEYKYYPWFYVLSSGFGFDSSDCGFTDTYSYVGSRLCTDTREKALYIAEQFGAEYKDFMLYTE